MFEQTQVAPETDALFFSKVAQAAKKTEGYHSETAASAYTKAKVFGMLKDILAKGKLRRYKANGTLVMYVTSAIMDALEQSTEFTRKIEITQIAEGGIGIETRVTDIDGVPVMEVIDDERFYDSFNWEPENGGFEPVKKQDRKRSMSWLHAVRPVKRCRRLQVSITLIREHIPKAMATCTRTVPCQMFLYSRTEKTAISTACM